MAFTQTINRGVILVVPKQAYFDWYNKMNTVGRTATDDYREFTSFLIKDEIDFTHPDEVLKKYWKLIFEKELEGMFVYEDMWPEKRTFKMFKEWFQCYISSMAWDLEKGAVWSEDL